MSTPISMVEEPSSPTRRWPAVLKILCLIALLIGANLLARSQMDSLDFKIPTDAGDFVHHTILMSAAVYALLLAIPFVPGVEVGLALMAMFGPPIAILVYLCTVAGLSLSFLLGRLIPLSVLSHIAADIRLDRTSKLLKNIEPLNKKERLAYLVNQAPRRFIPLLLRYRYLGLAVALNIPGNYIIGGGGGIALFAGISRLYSIPGFLVTIGLSVAPVPIAVMLIGTDFIAG